jgi:hypothetical protein
LQRREKGQGQGPGQGKGAQAQAQVEAQVEAQVHWAPDASAAACRGCSAPFSLFLRRHHCRRCGQVFCDGCSARRLPLPGPGNAKPCRVCSACAAELELEAAGEELEEEALEEEARAVVEEKLTDTDNGAGKGTGKGAGQEAGQERASTSAPQLSTLGTVPGTAFAFGRQPAPSSSPADTAWSGRATHIPIPAPPAAAAAATAAPAPAPAAAASAAAAEE